MKTILPSIASNLEVLREQNQQELASIFSHLVDVATNEPSDTFDLSALLKQIEVLTAQAALPKLKRKKLQITASLFYLSLFSHAAGIGKFLIEYRKRLDELLDN